MAWNYRKRIKIAPGIHLNLSKGGASTSIGPKGAKISIGKNGTYLNTSIPGTGVYNRQKISSNKFMSGRFKSNSKDDGSFFKPRNTWGCVFRWLGVIAFIFLIVNLFQLITGNYDDSEDNRNAIYGWGFIAASFVIVYCKRILSVFHIDFSKKDDKSQSDNVESDTIKERKYEMITISNIGRLDPILYDVAVYIVSNQRCNASIIQSKFMAGPNRTSRIVDQLEQIGVVKRSSDFRIDVLVKDLNSLESLFEKLQTNSASSISNVEKEQESVNTEDANCRDNNINSTHKMGFIDPKLFDIADRV